MKRNRISFKKIFQPILMNVRCGFFKRFLMVFHGRAADLCPVMFDNLGGMENNVSSILEFKVGTEDPRLMRISLLRLYLCVPCGPAGKLTRK